MIVEQQINLINVARPAKSIIKLWWKKMVEKDAQGKKKESKM